MEIAILVSIDDILVHVDKIPHGTHLGSKHLGFFPSFVFGLRALETVIPQRIGAHEHSNQNDYDYRHFTAQAAMARWGLCLFGRKLPKLRPGLLSARSLVQSVGH